MKETLEQKLARITKFGLNDVEIFENKDEEIAALKAHITHLSTNLNTAREGLEEVAAIGELGASGRDCGESAEVALANITLRQWRNISTKTEPEQEEEIEYFGKNPPGFEEEAYQEWIKHLGESES